MHDNVVAVFDRIPAYQYGIAQALRDAGYDVITTTDSPGGWCRDASVAVVAVRAAADLATLHAIAEHIEGCAIALLASCSCTTAAGALRAGATSVSTIDVPLFALRDLVAATASGHACFPAELLGRLLIPPVEDVRIIGLDRNDLQILQFLADGATVATVAKKKGYSERTMYRKLRALYHELGASTREDAIALLQAEGYLAARFTLPVGDGAATFT